VQHDVGIAACRRIDRQRLIEIDRARRIEGDEAPVGSISVVAPDRAGDSGFGRCFHLWREPPWHAGLDTDAVEPDRHRRHRLVIEPDGQRRTPMNIPLRAS
jgi:hypothetical protein